MGHPGYFIAGKMFAFLVEGGFAMKLAEGPREALLAQPNTATFSPGGQPMRNWVEVHLAQAEDYEQYQDYLQQAIEFVLEEAAK
jgi:hypothetical protein